MTSKEMDIVRKWVREKFRPRIANLSQEEVNELKILCRGGLESGDSPIFVMTIIATHLVFKIANMSFDLEKPERLN